VLGGEPSHLAMIRAISLANRAVQFLVSGFMIGRFRGSLER